MDLPVRTETQLASTIAKLHKSGAYSDFKIVCGQNTYNVHKAIICPQSAFFKAACRPDTFQEGRTGIIVIPATAGRDAAYHEKPVKVDDFDWDLDVETTTAVKLMIHYFYHHKYLEGDGEFNQPKYDSNPSSRTLGQGILAEHSRMYAMGEKYGIPGLKALAVEKFWRVIRKTNSGLTAAVMITYKGLPESDKRLRDKVVEALDAYRHDFAEMSDVQDVISEIPTLARCLYLKSLAHEKDLKLKLALAKA
ncbi:hypothetical protein D6D05_08435 [Aureobasidium pullulans]|nr:hypothetical protein D6D05_08435 [Aureobasidium pullulans]